MPQASDELRERWGPGCDAAMLHLESRGYSLAPDGSFQWRRPAGVKPTDADLSAATYLAHEFDFGGFEDHPQRTDSGGLRTDSTGLEITPTGEEGRDG